MGAVESRNPWFAWPSARYFFSELRVGGEEDRVVGDTALRPCRDTMAPESCSRPRVLQGPLLMAVPDVLATQPCSRLSPSWVQREGVQGTGRDSEPQALSSAGPAPRAAARAPAGADRPLWGLHPSQTAQLGILSCPLSQFWTLPFAKKCKQI